MKANRQDDFSLPSPEMEMDRRTFLRQASAAAAMFAMPLPGSTAKTIPMGVVVHSYGIRWNSKVSSKIYPGFQNALDLLNHCHQIGAGGIQVGVRDWASDFVTKIRDRREKIGLYLEGSIAAPKDTGDVARFDQDVKAAREAGAQVVRTVCSSGRRYEIFHSREDFLKAQKNALAYLQLAEPVLKKYQVKLAVENHKDWRAQELSDMIKQVSSEWIGVTLDFGNSISLLEDPMEVVETLAPHAFTTHVKDMGVAEFPQGFLLSEVPLGEGILDLNRMVTLCKKHNPGITFNLEMITRDPLEIPCLTDDYWSTFEDLSGRALARTLRMVKANPFEPTLPTVSQLSGEDRLAAEEKNIIQSFTYSKTTLGLK